MLKLVLMLAIIDSILCVDIWLFHLQVLTHFAEL